jgi:hypothetical protein
VILQLGARGYGLYAGSVLTSGVDGELFVAHSVKVKPIAWLNV